MHCRAEVRSEPFWSPRLAMFAITTMSQFFFFAVVSKIDGDDSDMDGGELKARIWLLIT